MPDMKLICFLIVVCLPHLSASSSSGDHNQFVYTGFTGTDLALDGVAKVTPDGLLELTNNTQRIKGHAFHRTPLSFHKFPRGTVRSFSTYFVFAILPSYADLSGHGLALVIAPSRDLSAAFPTQYLGLLNSTSSGRTSSHMFAVEIDTILNIELQDINDNHVGIDINDLRSMQSQDAGFYDDKSGVFKKLTLINREVMQVWVDYNEETTQISVTMAPINVAKPVRPLLLARYNLSKVLLDPSYIGFSSSTGTLSGQHYILGWSFSINGLAPAIDISKLPKLPHDDHKYQTRLLDIILPVATAVFLIVVGTGGFLIVQRRLRFAELREDWEVEFGAHRLSYKDLFYATDGFKSKCLLGIGGFGRVYKGVLPLSKLEVAVKRVSHDSKQGLKEFIAEVVTIGRLQHCNLVQLLGYCRRKDELLLVYDYMPNGSLDKYLHVQEGNPPLH